MVQFSKHEVDDWNQSKPFLSQNLKGYIFRGQPNANYALSTSLERCMNNFASKSHRWLRAEYWLLREYKRKFHLYSNQVPIDSNLLEWLSIMQHHGTPTRLIDFTYSLYIALFFAIFSTNQDAAIWALDHNWLKENVKKEYDLDYDPQICLKDQINKLHIEQCNEILSTSNDEEFPFLIPVEPERLSDRMSRQQGLFIMPASLNCSFDNNIESVLSKARNSKYLRKQKNNLAPILKIIISKSCYKEILYDLKQMNITSETLFPGLDGFSESLIQTIIRS
ncbi:MAG: FRG domain-containing protein [Desulfovibrionales bacterium]|nr:FRG domain-containing protein [Desulfovibrionales bacterium]